MAGKRKHAPRSDRPGTHGRRHKDDRRKVEKEPCHVIGCETLVSVTITCSTCHEPTCPAHWSDGIGVCCECGVREDNDGTPPEEDDTCPVCGTDLMDGCFCHETITGIPGGCSKD